MFEDRSLRESAVEGLEIGISPDMLFCVTGDRRTEAVIGAALAVHRELGRGFLEPVYQEALEIELKFRGVPYLRECAMPVEYRGARLATHYRVDFLCYDSVIVELKAMLAVTQNEQAQVLNYLRISKLGVGLLLNFGMTKLDIHRFANTVGGTHLTNSE